MDPHIKEKRGGIIRNTLWSLSLVPDTELLLKSLKFPGLQRFVFFSLSLSVVPNTELLNPLEFPGNRSIFIFEVTLWGWTPRELQDGHWLPERPRLDYKPRTFSLISPVSEESRGVGD